MKLLLTLALLLAAFTAPAQIFNFPAQGPTMTQFLSLSNSIPSATNSVTRNGTNTLTGTNIFPAAGFYPANGIGMRLLWSSPTNIYLASVVTNALLDLTNNGDFASGTYVASGTLPALMGSNSSLVCVATFLKTNGNTSAGQLAFYVGTNTNFVGYTTFANTSAGIGNLTPASGIFQLANSFTSQVQGNQFANPAIVTMTNFVDMSTSQPFYMSAFQGGNHTNGNIVGLRIYELYAP